MTHVKIRNTKKQYNVIRLTNSSYI